MAFFGQPVPVLGHCHSKEFFPYVPNLPAQCPSVIEVARAFCPKISVKGQTVRGMFLRARYTRCCFSSLFWSRRFYILVFFSSTFKHFFIPERENLQKSFVLTKMKIHNNKNSSKYILLTFTQLIRGASIFSVNNIFFSGTDKWQA